MTAIPQPAPRMISDRILDPLRQVARRQWLVLAAKGVLQTLVVCLGLLLGTALLFGFWGSMPVALRVILAVLVWGTVFVAGVCFLRPALHKRRLSQAAFKVEEQMPDVQERISSAVELSEETDARFAGSPSLVRHLVHQAEDDAGRVNPTAVIPTRDATRWAMILAPVLLLWLILMPLMPQPMMRGLFFSLMPWKTDAPMLLAEIGVKPGDARIAQGDSLEIQVRVSKDAADDASAAGRAVLTSKYVSGQLITRDLTRVEKSTSKFTTLFENVRESFQYKVEAADRETRLFSVTVLPRPSVAKLDLGYDFPTYTSLPDRETATATAASRRSSARRSRSRSRARPPLRWARARAGWCSTRTAATSRRSS